MKKILLSLVAIATLSLTSFGQAPEGFKYQAVVRDAGNLILNNQAVGMQLTIQQGSVGGTAVYTETFTPTTNGYGLVNLEIGSGTTTDDFTTIDWANGPFFMETAVDVTGGTSYAVMGTSQLMSVPYALYAKTSGNGAGPIGPQGPAGADGTNGTNGTDGATGLTGPAGADGTNGTNGTDGATGLTGPAGPAGADGTNGTDGATGATGTFQAGTTSGEMNYWNGSAWVLVAPTVNEAATLQMIGGVPTWVGGTPPIPFVLNPTTGKTWMDRNLGATQVATSSTDAAAYGDLYQWGRGTDGHQIRTSATTATLSSIDQPAHGNFILAPSTPWDWRSPQNTNLWQGVNGINNPCPSGYRIPTEPELEAERLSWSVNTSVGAFASALKLPVAGHRFYSNGSLYDVGAFGGYWSSAVSGALSRYLYFDSSGAGMSGNSRADGYSVRCLKD